MRFIFHEFLYRPLLNALIALYAFLPGHDLGLAIVVLTILVRLALSPLLLRQFRSQQRLADLQPHVDAIRKSTNDQAEQSRKLLKLYREHGVSPASGCLPVLVQLPILWAMYSALRTGLSPDALSALYPLIPRPESVRPLAFGFLNLAEAAIRRTDAGTAVSWAAVVLAVLTGVATYWQIRQTPVPRPGHSLKEDTTPAEQMAHRMSRQMRIIAPLTTVYLTLTFPAGLGLYWFVSTVVSVVQQHFLLRRKAS